MAYELTALLNRCTPEDAQFLLSIIDSSINFTDDRGLRELFASWQPGKAMPLELNHKLETEIRYLGSNDFAYMRRKLRGDVPAGVSVEEIIDDICKLMKIGIPLAETLEGRLEIFAGNVVDEQFRKSSPQRQRALIERMGFDEFRRRELWEKLKNNQEKLLPVLLPMLRGALGPQVLQGLILSVLSQFIGREAAKRLLVQVAQRIPVIGAALGPILLAGGAGWLVVDLAGPASRKTIPLMLYLGILALRDGMTQDFDAEFRVLPRPQIAASEITRAG